MPIHDWSRAPSGFFHHFHQRWCASLSDALNAGVLPEGYFALIEKSWSGAVPDVLTLQAPPAPENPAPRGGISVADAPPKTRFVSHADEQRIYAQRANRVAIHGPGDRIVAAIEIVSPGNKSARQALSQFIEKSVDYLRRGVNLLVLDLHPPTPRDPQGIHPLIWREIDEAPFELPSEKRLTLASYVASDLPTAYVEPVAPGDVLPDMPLFLDPDAYVRTPLEPTYEETWSRCPREFKDRVVASTQ